MLNHRFRVRPPLAGLLRFAALAIGLAGLSTVVSAPAPARADVAPPPPAPALDLLPVGAPAPTFTGVAHNGQAVDLAKLRGHYVVLYFYPKDDTPGCTKEACEFRDSWDKLQKLGVAVFGVSTQDNGSHQAFAEKHKLPFPLLADEKGELAAKYRIPIVGGKARRITYLIGKDGKISHVWPAVNPVGHSAEILALIPKA